MKRLILLAVAVLALSACKSSGSNTAQAATPDGPSNADFSNLQAQVTALQGEVTELRTAMGTYQGLLSGLASEADLEALVDLLAEQEVAVGALSGSLTALETRVGALEGVEPGQTEVCFPTAVPGARLRWIAGDFYEQIISTGINQVVFPSLVRYETWIETPSGMIYWNQEVPMYDQPDLTLLTITGGLFEASCLEIESAEVTP